MHDSKPAPNRQAAGYLHIGSFVGALEERFVALVAEEGRAGGVRVLVPSREVRDHLRRRLADRGVPTFDLRFQLLPELAESILTGMEARRTVPGPPWRLLGGMARQVLLAGLVRRWVDAGPPRGLRGVALQGGFPGALESTFTDLEEASVSANALSGLLSSAVAERPGGGDGSGEFADLVDLYARWEALLAERLLETRPRRMARAASAAGSLPDRCLLAYGFYDWSGVQERLLTAAAVGRECHLFVPRIEGSGRDYARPLLDRFRDLGFRQLELAATAVVAPSLSLVSAAGERREAEGAVRGLMRRLGRRPLALDRVAFLYRAPGSYAEALGDALERAGIPAHRLDPPRLAETPAGAAAGLLLAILAADFSRRSVLDFLDVALPLRPDGAGPDAVMALAAWEALTREAGVVGGPTGWDPPLASLAERLRLRRAGLLARPEIDEDEASESGGGADGRVRQLEARLEALAALRREIAALFTGLAAVAAAPSWSGLAASLADELARWLGATPEYAVISAGVRELAAIDATGEPVDARLAPRALAQVLQNSGAPGAERDPGGVFVGGVMAARGLSFDLVFLLGMNDRVFPRHAAPDPLLRDLERLRLEAAGYRLPLHGRVREEEAALFELATKSAPELEISWSRVDPATGKPRLPSVELLDFAGSGEGRRLRGEELDARAERAPLDRMAEAREAGRRHPDAILPFAARDGLDGHEALEVREFERLWVAAAVGAERGARLAGFVARHPAFRRALEAESARWERRTLTPWDARIGDPAALAWLHARFPQDVAWSATTLERYARCPFRFLVETLLEAEPLEEPEQLTRLDPIDRGHLLHAILREFLAAPGGLAALRDAPAPARARLREIALAVLAEFEATGRVGRPLLWELEQRRILEDLVDWFAFEQRRSDPLETRHLEWRFGMPASGDRAEDPASREEPLRVGRPATRQIAFKGRIDRVDGDPGGRCVRVIDYKSGKRPSPRRSAGFATGDSLQLPIYLLAAAGGRRNVTGIAEYLYLAEGTSADRVETSDLEQLEGELVTRAGILIDGLRAGLFFAYAGEARSSCWECRLAEVCGAGAEKRFARKRDDPALAAWLKLKGTGA